MDNLTPTAELGQSKQDKQNDNNQALVTDTKQSQEITENATEKTTTDNQIISDQGFKSTG